jgi:hypothetical protein
MEQTKFLAKIGGEVIKNSLDEITDFTSNTEKARLLAIQTEIQARLINIKKDIYCIGELLYEAKQTLAHGMFIPWIEQTFDKELPYSTAYFYMRVYEVFKGTPSTIQYIPSKYLLMITTREFPAEIVKMLNENPEKIDKESLYKINEVYDLFKSGTIGGSQFLKLAEKQIKLGIDIWKGMSKHRINTNMRHSLYLGAGDILKHINSIRKAAREMAGVYPYDPDSFEHKELIKTIEETIKGLQELKIDLEGGRGLFKSISTKDGDKYISNL